LAASSLTHGALSRLLMSALAPESKCLAQNNKSQDAEVFIRTLARLHGRNKNERGSTMKITKPFHGLTSGERKRLTEIRFLAQVDLATAKIVAADWVLSNNQRRVLRQAACRTVKLLDSL
jgi:hypothetical protein